MFDRHLPLSCLSPFLGKSMYIGVSPTVCRYSISFFLLVFKKTFFLYRYYLLEQTCLRDFAQFFLTDVIQMFLHLCSCLAHFSKRKLWVDEYFGHHGLRRNTQGWKILFEQQQKKIKHHPVKSHLT